MYIDPKFQLNRKFLYRISAAFILISLYGLFIKDYKAEDYVIYIHILINSTLYLALGVVVVHATVLRDKVFGINRCPHCNNKTWNVVRRLKINPNIPVSCKCDGCNKMVKLKNWPAFMLVSVVGIFMLSVLISNNVHFAYLASEAYLFCVVIIMVRFTPLRAWHNFKK